MPHPVRTTTLRFGTADGVDLVGDLALPDRPVLGAIVCHPHPRYGGNRHNIVVDALFSAMPTAGIAALRFDFRSEFDDGRGESLDAVAAIDTLADALTTGPTADPVPIVAVGYSFGAMIVHGLTDARVSARVLVAPPLARMDTGVGPVPDGPRLVLTPAHDQFSPPDATAPIIAEWPSVDHEVVPSADHSLTGRTADVAATTIAWLHRVTSGARHQM